MTSTASDAHQTPASSSLPASLPAHMPALDGLRGLAILLVLVHMLSLLEPQPNLPAYLLGRITHFGWTGVQLFFVLSGFLITGILLDTQRAKNYYSGFYARRALRIFPLYFGVLIVAFGILPAIGTVPAKIAMDQPHQIWLWTYLLNWSAIFGAGSEAFPHFWSLAVEEQFYLVWPLLIRSRNPVQCVRFCLIVAASSLVLRCILVWLGVSEEVIYGNTLCRMDALALGGAAAAALRIPSWKDRLVAMHDRFLFWSVVVTLLGVAVTRGFWKATLVGETLGYTIVSLMFALLIIAAAGADAAKATGWADALRLRPLRSLGKYSYAMYIFHKPLHDYVGQPLLAALNIDVSKSVSMSAAYVVAGTGVTYVVALASWHGFEKHFLKLKRFFGPKK